MLKPPGSPVAELLQDDGWFLATDHGVYGDGSNDDTSAIDATIDAASVAGGGTVYLPEGTFKVTSTISIPSNVTILGSGKTIIDASSISSTDIVFEAAGTAGTADNLASNATEGDTSVTVTSGSSFAAGDWAMLYSSALFGSTSQPKGEIVRISTAVGTTITFYDPICDDYATADTAALKKISFVENVGLERLRIIGPSDNTVSLTGASFDKCRDVVVKDCHFDRCHHNGLTLYDTIAARIHGNHFDRCEKSGLGYGIGVGWASQDVSIVGCTGHRIRHLVTVGGGSSRNGIGRRIAVSACSASQCAESGFDAHPAGEDISFVGNHVFGSDTDGITFQAARGIISNNTVRGTTRHGIFVQPLTNKPHDIVVSNNTVKKAGDRGILVSTNATYPNYEAIVVTGNSVFGTASRGIEVGTATAVTGLVVSNNVVRSSAGFGIIVTTADYATVSGNVVDITANSQIGIRLSTVTRATVTGNSVKSTSSTSTTCISLIAADDCTVTGNTGTGAATGILADSSSDNNVITGNNMRSNTAGYSLSTGTGNISAHNHGGVIASVASGATIALPGSSNSVYNITGTADITSITAVEAGRIVVLKFAGTAATNGLVDGSNLKLASTLAYTPDDAIALFCDGTNFHEIGRSVN